MVADREQIIEQVGRCLSALERVCCLTGAGVSAESGVPTFRGAGGLWRGQRAESLATPEAFEQDPGRVWQFYNDRRAGLLACRPNAAHTALSAMEDMFDDWTLITQNVDGLHAQAGSRRIIEIHGNIWGVRCLGCGQEELQAGVVLEDLPRCGDCGGLLRPAVVWFGEMLPADAMAEVRRSIERCQAFLVVGTSAVVQPAASLAYWAKARHAVVIEVNLEKTPLSADADYCIFGEAGVLLPSVVEALHAARPQC